MKEAGPNLLVQYLENYILKQAEETSNKAIATTFDDEQTIGRAIFFSDLLKYPDPYRSKDDAGLDPFE